MPGENILVIAVDGLRASALGAYGNTSYPTPVLDKFAAESLLFDWWFAERVELRSVCGALLQPISRLRGLGYSSVFVTDDPEIESLPEAESFQELIQLANIDKSRGADVSQTNFARIVAAACEEVEQSSNSPKLIWLHSRGMYGAWDAPLEYQLSLLSREEGDPAPIDGAHPPDLWLEENCDPDSVFRWSSAYAAQMMTLDACLADVVELTASSDRSWCVVFLGVRGFPLGEHRRLGGVDGRLYAEQLHVPMLIRFSDERERLVRTATLATHRNLADILLGDLRREADLPAIDSVLATGPHGERAIRTPQWSLLCDFSPEGSDSSDAQRCELFVRPDDRWEANDVANLCPEVVDELLARIERVPKS